MSIKPYKIRYTQNWIQIVDEDTSRIVSVELQRLIAALRECGYQITEPPSVLYNQVKEYILSTWSKNCISYDTGVVFVASNGNLEISFQNEPNSTPFLILTKGGFRTFSGYIRNIEDFKLLMELTSVQKPS